MTKEEFEQKRQEALKKAFDETYREDIEVVRKIARDFHSKGMYDERRALNWVADAAEKYLGTREWKDAKVSYMA